MSDEEVCHRQSIPAGMDLRDLTYAAFDATRMLFVSDRETSSFALTKDWQADYTSSLADVESDVGKLRAQYLVDRRLRESPPWGTSACQ